MCCANCATKARVEPAAKALYDEMKKAGFEDVVHFLPDGAEFWTFLGGMAENGACMSCLSGSGNPCCGIRICAKEKGMDMCALCADYPCDKFAGLLAGYPMLKGDNALLREKGMDAWMRLQDDRRATRYTYSDPC